MCVCVVCAIYLCAVPIRCRPYGNDSKHRTVPETPKTAIDQSIQSSLISMFALLRHLKKCASHTNVTRLTKCTSPMGICERLDRCKRSTAFISIACSSSTRQFSQFGCARLECALCLYPFAHQFFAFRRTNARTNQTN